METQEVKLPSHLSNLYKKMVVDGLIVDKKYVGEIPLAEYLKSVESSDSTEEKPPTTTEEQEPSIPLSEVKKLVASELAKALASLQPQKQEPVKQSIDYAPPIDSNDIPELRNWEMKDRTYVLADGSKPISFSITHQHTQASPLSYINKETKKLHALRYATNQLSFFMDQQSKEPGSVSTAHIIFKNGTLNTSGNDIALQQFLTITPENGPIFKEFDATEKSRKAVEAEDLDFEAKKLAREIGDSSNRVIASLICLGYIDSWDISIVKEEIYSYIKKEPKKYIELAKDPTLKFKGVARTAIDRGYLVFDKYRFLNDRKEVILEVGRNVNEYDAIAEYFQTNEGRTTYDYLSHAIS